MIYEKIPRKYIYNADKEFEKFVNSNKYSPEAHYCEFMWMLHFWLDWSQDAVTDAETSGGAVVMANNMKTLDKLKDDIYETIENYFDGDEEKYTKWLDEHKSQGLHDERYEVLQGYLSSEHVFIYLKSCNLTKIFDKFGVEFELSKVEN